MSALRVSLVQQPLLWQDEDEWHLRRDLRKLNFYAACHSLVEGNPVEAAPCPDQAGMKPRVAEQA